ncbi:TetR/AcrR family transcriptional regulator [Serinicoccus kebangsaanensis]|uniref:TetR/AcrR family transcriptional regulator n=1 Tax=Serinicoccus kebangsaanensis TaxID=2602069 RepID=UPI00178C2F06|nr:TetR/AcrR family transcriptional regulator [Serinicoccus kebangsaanensis]
MAKGEQTRSRLLDAFEDLVIEHGERAGTLAATADEAGVSKGGLLYHFGSKDALVQGLAERLEVFAAEEERRLSSLPDVLEVFLRESVAANQPFDRTYLALLKLGQLDEHHAAREALARLDDHFLAALTQALGDPDLALLVLRVSDGIYVRTALGGSDALPADSVDRLLALLATLPR